MSLTSHIADRASPVHQWLRQRLPHTQSLATRVNTELRGGPPTTPASLPVEEGVDAALLGTAVGYVLTAATEPADLRRNVAGLGAARVDRINKRMPQDPSSAVSAADQALDRLAELRPDPEGSERPWREATDLALLLARFEQVHRAGAMTVWRHIGPASRRWRGGSLEELVAGLASAADRSWLVEFARTVVRDHDDLLTAHEMHFGPEFALSGLLGGADADVIADGVLWELKSTAGPSVVTRRSLWQLAGYLLADTTDEYRLHSVGFSALRRRQRHLWFAEEYLAEMSRTDRPLAAWREEFAALLQRTRAAKHPSPEHSLAAPRAPSDGCAAAER